MGIIGTTIGINTETNEQFIAQYAIPYSVICDPAYKEEKIARAFKLASDVLMRFRLIIEISINTYVHMPVAQAVHNPDDCIQFHGPVIRINQNLSIHSVMLVDDLGFLLGTDERTGRYPGQDEMQIHFMLQKP